MIHHGRERLRIQGHPFLERRLEHGKRFDEEMSEKTSEEVDVDQGRGEEVDASAEEDLRTAGGKVGESYERLYDDNDGSREGVDDSIAHTRRATDTAGRQVLRAVEDTVYQSVMTRFTPYYFDGGLISANLD